MRILSLLISAILVIFSATGSSHGALYWVKTYGETADEEAYSIQQTTDGGYIVAGTQSNIGGNKDILVLKLDSNGNVDWQKTYDNNHVDEAFSVQQTADGGFIVGGNTGTGTLCCYDAWILKLNEEGDIIWQKTYGIDEDDGYARSIQQTTDGGYIVVGSFVPDVIWVMKLNSQGDILWQKDFGSRISAKDIRQTADGGYIVFGGAGYTAYVQLVIKLDSAGNVSWGKALASVGVGFGLSYPSSIIQTTNGEYIVMGKYINYDGVGGVSIIKLDSNGNLLWHMFYGDMHYKAYSIQQTTDGGYIIAGANVYTDNAWVLKLDSTGGIEWQKTYNESNEDYGYSVQQTRDGGYIVAGSAQSPGAGKDVWILKLDSFGDIPDCNIVATDNADISPIAVSIGPCCSNTDYPDAIAVTTNGAPQDTFPRISVTCCSDTDDYDCDGIPNAEDDCPYDSYNDIDADSICGDIDNCPNHPNGSSLGTCIIGTIGLTCTDNEDCGEVIGYCSRNQEDDYPPNGNGIGDACDCEGNFNCDADNDVDGTDAATFKTDFGRGQFDRPCITEATCHGDFNCDHDCDGTDAARFKQDFGRSAFSNPCPTCTMEAWCMYE